MAVKAPGYNDNTGNRNRRVNRYSVSGGNNQDRRHKAISGTTIGYDAVPTPDEITDSGNGLAVFEVDENVDVQGSTSNDDEYTVQTVAAGALGVDQSVTTEVAGDQTTLRSMNNRNDNRFS